MAPLVLIEESPIFLAAQPVVKETVQMGGAISDHTLTRIFSKPRQFWTEKHLLF
jgi:hypothetical protein